MENKQKINLVLIFICSISFVISGIFINLIRDNGIFNDFTYDIGVALGYLICFFEFGVIGCYLIYKKQLNIRIDMKKDQVKE